MTRRILLILLAAAILIGDQISKHYIATHFLPGESRIVIPHVLYLTWVQNYHGAFGLFGPHPLLLTAAAAVVLVIFYAWYRREGATTLVHVAFALIFAGAVGNIIDRVRFGYVNDFVDLRWWPVFNVADSAITIGVCLLLVQMLIRDRRQLPRPSQTTSGETSPALDAQPADEAAQPVEAMHDADAKI